MPVDPNDTIGEPLTDNKEIVSTNISVDNNESVKVSVTVEQVATVVTEPVVTEPVATETVVTEPVDQAEQAKQAKQAEPEPEPEPEPKKESNSFVKSVFTKCTVM
jgi:hypothetical protein